MGYFIKMLCQLILSPVQGWNDVSHDAVSPARIAKYGFYPLIAVAALAYFLQGVYHPGIPGSYMVQRAIVMFVSYFVSYYIAQFVFSVTIHRYVMTEPSDKHNCTFILYSLSLLALATLVENCIPIDMPVMEFTAIYVALVMFRGTKYMAVFPDRTGAFMLMSIAAVLIPPFVISFLFNLVIPSPY